MMKSGVAQDVEWYLKGRQGLEATKLGPSENQIKIPALDADRRELIARLHRREKTGNQVLWVTVSAYLVILAGGFILAFLQRDQPTTLRPVLGGAFLSLIIVGHALRSLWRDKSKLDLLLEVVPVLSSDQLVLMLQAFYFGQRGKVQ